MSAGLQSERTELAWSRTALSCWVAALITLKAGFPSGTLALIAPVTVTAIARTRRRQLQGAAVPAPLPPGAAVLVAAACMLIAIVGAFA